MMSNKKPVQKQTMQILITDNKWKIFKEFSK